MEWLVISSIDKSSEPNNSLLFVTKCSIAEVASVDRGRPHCHVPVCDDSPSSVASSSYSPVSSIVQNTTCTKNANLF